MSSAEHSENGTRSGCRGNGDQTGNWSALNITAMVLGFILFWPIGLLILYGNIKGVSVKEMPRWFRQKWWKPKGDAAYAEGSDNVVFNEYQAIQYDRIREIKEEVKERSRRFNEFRENAKRRADEEEFNRFMSEVPARNEG